MKDVLKYLEITDKNYFKLLVIPEDVENKNEIMVFLEKNGYDNAETNNDESCGCCDRCRQRYRGCCLR